MRTQDRDLVEYAGDVVKLLTDQHEQLRDLMGEVLAVAGDERRRVFAEVRGMLARHEAAEEAVLRPLTRSAPGGEELAATRTAEEERAKDVLAVIEQLDVDSPGFEVQYRELWEAVLRHAELEETEEFPLLRRSSDPETLRAARQAVEAVEDGAPHRPDGSPFATVVERARELFSRS